MADFAIKLASDPNWDNALFLSGTLPLTDVDAAGLGLAFGADYQIGRIGDTTSFSVAEPLEAPTALGNAVTLSFDQNVQIEPQDIAGLLFSGDNLTIVVDTGSAPEPAGLTSDAAGDLTGVPTATGTTTVTYRAENSAGTATASITYVVNAVSGADGIALPDPVILTFASETQIVITLPADPLVTNRTINDRVVALVPAAAYVGNEQNPGAWTASGEAQWAAFQDAQAQVTFNGTYAGDYVAVWEARDTTTNPRTDSDWTGLAINVAVATSPPVVDTINLVGDTITSTITDADDTSLTAVWASAAPGADPTYTIAGGWSGTTHETGTFTVTEGGDTDTISLSAATPVGARELTLYYYDGDDNLTAPERLPFTMPDETAPTVSNASGTQTGETTADWQADTTEAGGTLYAAAYPDGAPAPTAAELQSGSGGSIVSAENMTPGTGANSGSFTALSGGTTYRVAVMHVDGDGNDSNMATSAPFTTAAPSGLQAPVRLLSAPYTNSTNPTTTHTTPSVTPTGGRPVIVIVHTVTNTSNAPAVPATFTFGGVAFDQVLSDNQGQAATYIGIVHNPGTSAQAAVFSPDGGGTRSAVIEILEVPGAALSASVGGTADATGSGAATVNLTTQNADSLALYVGSRVYQANGLSWSGIDANLSTTDSGDTNVYQDVTGQIAWEFVAVPSSVSASTNAPTESKQSALIALEVKAA